MEFDCGEFVGRGKRRQMMLCRFLRPAGTESCCSQRLGRRLQVFARY
jgi:hypothetical protein